MLPQKDTRMSDTEKLIAEYVELYNTIMSTPDDRKEDEALMAKLKDLSITLTMRYLFENGYTLKKDKNKILCLIEKE